MVTGKITVFCFQIVSKIEDKRMKNNACFDCLNHGDGSLAENTGWYYPCNLGVDNEGLQDVSLCDKWEPNKGFQIGGYYSHMHFEWNKAEHSPCLSWVIHSDGEFPTKNKQEMIRLHICDFNQIEEFVNRFTNWNKND